ncbi:VanZ like family protein [Paracholeplasma brassicae]|uniref:VanZ like family protein n=1 Tax=Acholeplasma brassicae TaxID=61635 RepID=U4KMA2_9MOLU|nr:VanZ family protein [Paracholeplasma brassicae]CCV65185.1 VanZ like family protein [Paracholeplasma brassicae]
MKKRRTWLIIALFWSGFIFYNSLMPASVSSSQSGLIRDLIYPIITKVGIPIELPDLEFIIRKLAHFFVFFVFSILWFIYFMCSLSSKKTIKHVIGLGLLQAIIDETIQLFADGRSGEVRDVLIDFSGVLFGLLLSLIIRLLFKWINTRQLLSKK